MPFRHNTKRQTADRQTTQCANARPIVGPYTVGQKRIIKLETFFYQKVKEWCTLVHHEIRQVNLLVWLYFTYLPTTQRTDFQQIWYSGKGPKVIICATFLDDQTKNVDCVGSNRCFALTKTVTVDTLLVLPCSKSYLLETGEVLRPSRL